MRISFKPIITNCLFLFLFSNSSFAQTVNLKDFEKLATIKTVREYLEKKEFVVKQDSSSGKDVIKLKLVNKATKEIVHLSSIKGSEGDKTFGIKYFTVTQEEYGKIVHTILKSGYNAIGDTRHYEKLTGKYETHKVVLKAEVEVKGWDYYGIEYSYYAAKELAESVMPK